MAHETSLPNDRFLNKNQLIAKEQVKKLGEINENIKKMDIKNPKTSIWLIPVVSLVINGLNRIFFNVQNPWVIFGIYIAGFVLIGYLSNVYRKEKSNERTMHFLKMVLKDEKSKIDANASGDIIKSFLKNQR